MHSITIIYAEFRGETLTFLINLSNLLHQVCLSIPSDYVLTRRYTFGYQVWRCWVARATTQLTLSDCFGRVRLWCA